MNAFGSIVPERRIALLIDADNIQAVHIGQALEKLAPLGTVAIRRAYGNWELRKDIPPALQQHGIRAFHQPALTDHKNGSDITLAVDAIDLLHTQPIDAFAILSSDVDFTPLMLRLREAGRDVYGFGEAKTAKALRSACTRFSEVGDEPDLRARVMASIATCKISNGSVPLTSIGAVLRNDGISYDGALNVFLLGLELELTPDKMRCIVG